MSTTWTIACQSLVAVLPQPTLLCDARGIVQAANESAAALHRYPLGELVGRSLDQLGQARAGHTFLTDTAPINEMLARLHHGQEFAYQAWHPRRGAGRFPVSITIRALAHPPEVDALWLVTLFDERAEEGQQARMRLALDDAESIGRLKSDVLKRAGHDLRTPLTAIMGFCDLLMLDHPADSTYGATLSRIRFAGSELNRQFDRLVIFFKLLDGTLPFDLRAVEPASIIRDVCQRWRERVAAARLDFRQLIDDSVDRIQIVGDAQRIGTILDELIANSMAATDQGIITVSVQRSDQAVVFTVGDEGCGFPFYGPQGLRAVPAAGNTGEARAGLGIGLPMAKRLASAQGASLKLAQSGANGSRMELHTTIWNDS